MEILVIYGRLELTNYLLGTRACSVLCLRQLVHGSRVHMVDLTSGTNNGTATAGLRVNYCLSLCQGLRLSRLDTHTADLVH